MLAIAKNGLTNGVVYGIIRHNTRTAVRYIWKKDAKENIHFSHAFASQAQTFP